MYTCTSQGIGRQGTVSNHIGAPYKQQRAHALSTGHCQVSRHSFVEKHRSSVQNGPNDALSFVCPYVCIYICIYIYIEREREMIYLSI